jgi:dihydrolipoamide dehydrogenase
MYDLIIVGGGPGGYNAAERAGALGMSVLLIEKEALGGVCLNVGCIPTKTLLNSAKQYIHGKEADKFGVHFDNPRFELPEVMKWKQKVVQTLVKGVESQMKRHKVEVVRGEAEFVDSSTVRVGEKRYQGKYIIIATGSSPAIPPIPGIDASSVMTSTEALELESLPDTVVIIGGGVIGMEFASFFSSVDVKVHVIEMLPDIVPMMDSDIAAVLRRELKNKVDFHLGATVESIEGNRVRFRQNGEEKTIEADKVLLSVGRKPNLEGNGFDTMSLDYTADGIRVDERMRTNLPNVYAVGDVNGRSLLAHSAYRMGEVAVNDIAGVPDRMRYHAVPWVVYTIPEGAGCGLTEKQAEEEGRDVRVGSLPMRTSGRFLAEHGFSSGTGKVIADNETDTIVGVHLIGGPVSEIIYGAAAMIEAELRVRDVRELIFPHPTVAEIIRNVVWEL